MDQTMVGEVTLRLMDFLEDLGDEGEIIEVGIVAVVDVSSDTDRGDTVVRLATNTRVYHEIVGLFTVALDVARDGTDVPESDIEESDD